MTSLPAHTHIEKLDEQPLSPRLRARIAYRILTMVNRRDEIVSKTMSEYLRGFPDQTSLRSMRQDLSIARHSHRENYQFHLAWGLLPEPDELDGYLAEYYYGWAQNLGIGEESVSNIISEIKLESDS